MQIATSDTTCRLEKKVHGSLTENRHQLRNLLLQAMQRWVKITSFD